MRIPSGRPAGLEEFISAVSNATDRDLEGFLRPRLEETTIPELRAETRGDSLSIRQSGAVFEFPLDIEVISGADILRTSVWIRRPEAILAIPGFNSVPTVHPDPKYHLLIHRVLGDHVSLRVKAPGAQAVSLGASFTSKPIRATRDGEVWLVQLSLTAGQYAYWWTIDGEREPMKKLVVEPRLPTGEGALP